MAETEFLRRISPDLEIPYTIQTGLGIEREVVKNLVATADYGFTRGAHLWRETNINAPQLPDGFASFTDYLLSRDFDNRPDSRGARPVASANADIVRFDLGANTATTGGRDQGSERRQGPDARFERAAIIKHLFSVEGHKLI